ncbi:hypothetical protein ACOSQ3_031548 [Xanthoceras sorbifolium]
MKNSPNANAAAARAWTLLRWALSVASGRARTATSMRARTAAAELGAVQSLFFSHFFFISSASSELRRVD